MKRTVIDILKEYRENDETMRYAEFRYCMDGIYYALRKATTYPDGSDYSKQYLRLADRMCGALSDCFDDVNDNLASWMRGEPVKLYSPNTGEEVKTEVRDDFEAIYYCLCYGKMLENGVEPDDDFMECLEKCFEEDCWE